jgi:hypothetical protein
MFPFFSSRKAQNRLPRVVAPSDVSRGSTDSGNLLPDNRHDSNMPGCRHGVVFSDATLAPYIQGCLSHVALCVTTLPSDN